MWYIVMKHMTDDLVVSLVAKATLRYVGTLFI